MTRYKGLSTEKNMKSKRRRLFISIFFLSLVFVACSFGCRKKTPPQGGKLGSDVVATVNGQIILVSDVEAWVNSELKKIGAKASELPPAFIEQYKKELRDKALETLIVEHLLNEKVKQAKIVISDEELNKRMSETIAEQQPKVSLQEYKKKLEEYGQSFEKYKNEFRKQLSYIKLLEPIWAEKISITEEVAKQYYSENKNKFENSEQVRASHILITPDISDPNADPNEAKAKAKAKAEDLLKQIKAGADFAELAKANSTCPSSAKGGDLDFFSRGMMVTPFEKVAFELKPGQISDVVETKFGFHIIKVTDHKDASVSSFEQVKDDLIKQLIQQKRSELAQEYIESLKDKAIIVYNIQKEKKP
jgi:peptidyl-prolyl cis-trans isomerase C